LYQEAKNFPAAVTDFNRIISDYSNSAETETALLQKGLTLGQQGDYGQMTATFRQLLKTYPNTTGAAQAYYWIGWAAFEAKKYQDAVAPLVKARELNANELTERTSLRLMLCYQFLLKKAETGKEVDDFLKRDPDKASMVADVCRWLGTQYYNENNYDQAAKYLGLTVKDVEPVKVDKSIWFMLAKSRTELKTYQDAIEAANHYLEGATEPADRSQGFLALGSA